MNNAAMKKHRFNIIDFVLIIAVLACAIGIALRSNVRPAVLEKANDKAVLTVIISSLLESNADALVEGDVFYNQYTNKKYGTLLSKETRPGKIRYGNIDGTITVANYVDRVDVICKIEVEGLMTENGFMLGGTTFVGSGSDAMVRSQHIDTAWYVLDVDVLETAAGK